MTSPWNDWITQKCACGHSRSVHTESNWPAGNYGKGEAKECNYHKWTGQNNDSQICHCDGFKEPDEEEADSQAS